MLTRDELRETEDFFFDATPYVSANEWNMDAPPRAADSASDARPSGDQGRIIVVGFDLLPGNAPA